MLFSSIVFISVFLPITLTIYFFLGKQNKTLGLLLASLVFYAWGEPKNISIMLLICLTSYMSALFIEQTRHIVYKKIFLTIDVLLTLGTLIYFKYFNFIIENVNLTFPLEIPYHDVIMPLGISFFVFQALSYVIDVYRAEVSAQKNLYKLALYISFFPQLIAGPIVKYHDIVQDIEHHDSTFRDVVTGLERFITGLGKKVLLANPLGQIADSIFNNSYTEATAAIAWIGAICYSLQLFYDFSGYSDMAIGLGRIFGFHFLENFNYPYISKSITDFWRRWHISLGTWFREYVYIPLGGNRKSNARTYSNLFIVFLATGLWHGANWTFILWGIWHGLFIIIERMVQIKKAPTNSFPFLRHLYTIFVFVIGWTMFRADSVTEGLGFIGTMLGVFTPERVFFEPSFYLSAANLIIIFLAIIFSMPLAQLLPLSKIRDDKRISALYYTGLLGILLVSMANLAGSTYNPFIYFRF